MLVFMDGRKWTLDEWKEVFFENPIIKVFAVKLIWGIYDNNNKLLNTFRYMEDGSFNNAYDEEITIEGDVFITLISPIEIDKSLIEKWKNQLSDYDIIQPFTQLSLENKDDLIAKIPKTITVGAMKSLASKFSMEKNDGDGGFIYSYFIYDTYKDAYIIIEPSNVYYGSSNSDETDIKIKFENTDERFEYGAYLMLSDSIK